MMKRIWALALALCLLLPGLARAEAADETAQEPQARRAVYLTFDDGPKQDTPELLALLDELDVPATFFLVGMSVKAFPENTKLILEAGHAVGCHGMNHAPSMFKESTDSTLRELTRFSNTMRELVNPDFSTDLFRFPGGSTGYGWRTKAFVRDSGYAWFDWNVMTGDAQYTFNRDEDMLAYTIGQVREQDVVVLLMHEGKARTRRILPDLVAFFRENGYEFRVLSTGGEDREILSRCKFNMMMPDAPQEVRQAAQK